MYLDTRIARFDAAPGDRYRPTSTPIYQTATFEQESSLGFGEYDYSRSGNPTRTVLEERLAELEGGRFGFAFSSGVGALSALLRASTPRWILIGADLYGGTTRLLERVVRPLGIKICSVDTTDLAAVKGALASLQRERVLRRGEGTAGLVLLETPSNPLLRVTDIEAVARLVHDACGKLCVDNTALSPYLQNPLALGADVVVHSATKHLGGHGDVTAGAIVTSDAEIAEAVRFLQNAEGSALAPFDSWLLLRGMKTLGVRVVHESRSAMEVATFLEGELGVGWVHYPGLKSTPGYEVQVRQARGFGQLISFRTGDLKRSQLVAEGAKLFHIAVSFGSTNSTISLPCRMSHASAPSELIPADLVRISIGLEDPRDLIEDLRRVLRRRNSPLPKANSKS